MPTEAGHATVDVRLLCVPQFNYVVSIRAMWYFRTMLQQQLGLRLAALRKARELTQVQLAKALGCSVEFVSLVERGVNAPSVAGLEKYARLLRVDVADLFRFKAAKSRRQTPSHNRA